MWSQAKIKRLFNKNTIAKDETITKLKRKRAATDFTSIAVLFLLSGRGIVEKGIKTPINALKAKK